MLSLLLALTLAAAPAAEPGRLTVTFALQRPLIALEEDSWRERRADWEPAFHFARQALLLGTPTAGAAVDWQWGCFDRAAAELGRRRVVAVTPTVGSEGWEASNNPAWLPYGGYPQIIATPRETWLAALAARGPGPVAITLEGVRRLPTAAELGAWLDAALAALPAGQVELWLPAELLIGAPAPVIQALTPERLARLAGVTWLDVPQAQARAAQTSEPPVTEPEHVVRPTLLAREDRPRELLERLLTVAGAAKTAFDLPDSPRCPLRQTAAIEAYLGQVRRVGVRQVVVRGRLDTPQAPVWAGVLRRLGEPAGEDHAGQP